MAEREVAAYVIGKRYDCDECGAEMVRDGVDPTVLTTWPPKYPHRCANGHVANLTRSYPGHNVLITNEDVPRAIRRRQPPVSGSDS
ncbi:hypothetical protein [Nocardioides aquiterrae]|uniref:Uncharacterized protein n=1 Tax=Nocardioides aquiterrae TaxID=203799 RepID=A0ABP4EY12_9ACTN